MWTVFSSYLRNGVARAKIGSSSLQVRNTETEEMNWRRWKLYKAHVVTSASVAKENICGMSFNKVITTMVIGPLYDPT